MHKKPEQLCSGFGGHPMFGLVVSGQDSSSRSLLRLVQVLLARRTRTMKHHPSHDDHTGDLNAYSTINVRVCLRGRSLTMLRLVKTLTSRQDSDEHRINCVC